MNPTRGSAALEPETVAFPAVHELAFGLTAAFLGRAAEAGALLRERGVAGRPALMYPGRTLVVVAYQDFSDSPVGPYRQVSVSLPVHLPGSRGSARAPWPLPLLMQALWNTETRYRDLHFHVTAIPVSLPAAADYSLGIWGEPAWMADIGATRERSTLEVSVAEAGGGEEVLSLTGRATGLGLRERRGYRLVSRLGEQTMVDTMRIDAPAWLGFGPARARLKLGPSARLSALVRILGPRPACIQVLTHAAGTVTFGGPRQLLPGGNTAPAGRGEG